MDSACVLVVSSDVGINARLKAAGRQEGFGVGTVPLETSGSTLAARDDFNILIVHFPPAASASAELVGEIRARFHGHPLQIVAVAETEAQYRTAVEVGADDVLSSKASDLELGTRLRAASFRHAGQQRFLREREFFRQAVQEEESVNARILDRNRYLSDACRSLESIRRELERSNQQLQKVARFDMLSGLLNRVTLFSTMDMEIERAVRSGTPLSGFMTDIDNFKNINDNWGHPSGDEVIRTVGVRMSQSLRKYDHAGRYGGEEFFVVLPNAELDRAEQIAERFRAKLTNQPISFGSDELFVTASIGVAEFKPAEPREAWVTRADQAMYLAKQQGRDRVCVVS